MSCLSKIVGTILLLLVVGMNSMAQRSPLMDGPLFGAISDEFYAVFRERVASKLAKFGVRDARTIDEGTRDLADGFAFCFLSAAEASSDPMAKMFLESACEDSSAECSQEAIDPVRLKQLLDAMYEDMEPCIDENIGQTVGLLKP